jgi:hypothetical protein
MEKCITKTIQQLVLSKDVDNYKIASEILRVHPDLHTAIYFAFSYCQELLSFTWGDGDNSDGQGDGEGHGNCTFGRFANFEDSGYGYSVGDGNIDYQ